MEKNSSTNTTTGNLTGKLWILLIREKFPKTLWLIGGRQDITKQGNLRFTFDNNSIRKVWVPRRPDKKRRDKLAVFNSELLFRNNEKKNRWGGSYSEFDEPRASSNTERNKKEPEIMSSIEESDVVKPWKNFRNVELEDYIIAKKKSNDIQVNHVIEKPKTKNTKAEENLKKAEIDFMIDLKILTHKTSVDPKMLH